MPLIEELPVSQTIKASHGWAYVPDTGPIAAQQPGTRDRKRAAAAASSRPAATSTAKKEKAVQQRLDSLNKENYKDVVVPIPPSNRERDKGRKVTSNVKRILGYQRNFAHYLADIEANYPGESHYRLPNAPTAMGPPPTPALARQGSSAMKDSTVNRRRSAVRTPLTNASSRPTTPTETPTRGTKRSRQSSRSQSISMTDAGSSPAGTPVKKEEPAEESGEKDTAMTEATTASTPTQPESQHPPPGAPNEFENYPPYPTQWDTDPLLASTAGEVPPMPTDRIMQILISEPPLTFTAARAIPLDEDKRPPPRRFCGICGYWGKVKCKKCEEWTCGLMECWRNHEGTCPMANVY
ncbi:hypothetical protein PMZ80_000742 [Knufia obscura]|uniref:HIT-type domain-containing protein n=2 Tax=Knufia TaxID=430999 RepID=A0AAN8I2Q3_9EURO|nr:hypothetical protein PMZ80_000742 [Knufia obscura]KAK5949114.1 hypothetical protein OHC33_009855 [Knufia fluminis]